MSLALKNRHTIRMFFWYMKYRHTLNMFFVDRRLNKIIKNRAAGQIKLDDKFQKESNNTSFYARGITYANTFRCKNGRFYSLPKKGVSN